ncbi:hypothetical protein DM77_3060 [Burkholderia mallei]|nr:hypothetical protein DM77_3060 [Burkholderia mallei]KOT21772.1 hypothetical protein DM52_1984 [Burkholderia mallei]
MPVWVIPPVPRFLLPCWPRCVRRARARRNCTFQKGTLWGEEYLQTSSGRSMAPAGPARGGVWLSERACFERRVARGRRSLVRVRATQIRERGDQPACGRSARRPCRSGGVR